MLTRSKKFILPGLIFFCRLLFAGELQIIATCDIHGKMREFSRLAPVIGNYPSAVKIDLGDLFHGDPLNDLLHGSAMIEALNIANYDIFIPGNHEFELSPGQVGETLKHFKGQIAGQFRLPGIKNVNWVLIQRDGFSCAIIGMTDNNLFRNRRFYPAMEIVDEIVALDQALAEIRKIKVDAVVLARHAGNYFSGTPSGKVLYRRPEIDLMICGHTHQEIAGLRRGRTMIVQPGAFAASAILVTLRKAAKNKLHIQSKLLRPQKEPDRKISSLYFRESRRLSPQLSAVALPAGERSASAHKILEEMKRISQADAGIIELPELPEKAISMREFLRRFPYRNYLAVIEVNQDEYRELRKEPKNSFRRRYSTNAPADKERFTVVLNTFILSRSKVLPRERQFRILPAIERELILKGAQL